MLMLLLPLQDVTNTVEAAAAAESPRRNLNPGSPSPRVSNFNYAHLRGAPVPLTQALPALACLDLSGNALGGLGAAALARLVMGGAPRLVRGGGRT